MLKYPVYIVTKHGITFEEDAENYNLAMVWISPRVYSTHRYVLRRRISERLNKKCSFLIYLKAL